MLLYEALTNDIIASAYEVHRLLGPGFLEKVYENALAYELRSKGILCIQQEAIEIFYKDIIIGKYIVDIFIENKIIIEIKANSGLCEEHHAQLLNYLKGTRTKVGLLFNFGLTKLQIKRIIN